MQIESLSWTSTASWRRGAARIEDPALVLYFGTREALAGPARFIELKSMFPGVPVVGCSTGGHIHNDDVTDATMTAFAVSFASSSVRIASSRVDQGLSSRAAGLALGERLARPDLAGIFVLSDGLSVNGSELVAGLREATGGTVPLTGGLAGDGAAFGETVVGADTPPMPKMLAAIGFYGKALSFRSGSAGGWDVFGPRRRITRSTGNVLFELDGQPALDLYERYLGPEEIEALPGSALLFPLRIFDPERPEGDLVRTVLAVDRQARSMTFAGDMPEGHVAQLMRGTMDGLTAGAADAARQARTEGDGLALLVSCIGRRLLMGQRINDELDAVAAELGPRVVRAGFYSYGELCPHAASGMSELHNQTMTITMISEAA